MDYRKPTLGFAPEGCDPRQRYALDDFVRQVVERAEEETGHPIVLEHTQPLEIILRKTIAHNQPIEEAIAYAASSLASEVKMTTFKETMCQVKLQPYGILDKQVDDALENKSIRTNAYYDKYTSDRTRYRLKK